MPLVIFGPSCTAVSLKDGVECVGAECGGGKLLHPSVRMESGPALSCLASLHAPSEAQQKCTVWLPRKALELVAASLVIGFHAALLSLPPAGGLLQRDQNRAKLCQ